MKCECLALNVKEGLRQLFVQIKITLYLQENVHILAAQTDIHLR